MLTIVCMALVIMLGCSGDDSDDNSIIPTEPVKKGYPTLNILQNPVNVFGGAKVDIQKSQLLLNSEQVATWSDESGKDCKVAVTCNDKAVSSGDILDMAGVLIITVTNDYDNATIRQITLYVMAATAHFSSLNLQAGEEVNLLDGITFVDGVTLLKTELEMDSVRHEIADPTHFTPKQPGDCSLIFTVQGRNGVKLEQKYEVTIKPMDFQTADIRHLQPKDILPIVGQINKGDKKAYEHIEHLRIAECTRVRDMMWQYGAGSHSFGEYQKLMLRLYTGMMGEKPEGFDNFELVGKDFHNENDHGHDSWDILCSIIQHANMVVLEDRFYAMPELLEKSPTNAIFIFALSKAMETPNKEDYDKENTDYYNGRNFIKRKDFLWFVAGSNVRSGWNIICQEDISLPDDKSMYGIPQSSANGKNDATINKHIMLTVGTNENGDADVANGGSRYPMGFHPDVLFSGRCFPYHTLGGDIYAPDGNYTTSHTNYTNLAMTDLCFQMFAEVADVDQLMKMIRATTLTNKIHLDGKTQNLHLINPAGFFQKYLMPTVPTSITEGKTAALQRGYYHGVVFNIPGAEVNINGEWVLFSKANQERIMSQNPFTLQWRINSEYFPLMGYKRGDSVKGQLIAVDDQWQGLNITQDVTITIN
ncbi:MAG: hypothetical protein J5529_01300 [Prevotella sp.]|nr:hypothetical protein [Prevotella sp.]